MIARNYSHTHADKARDRSSGEIVALKKVRFDHSRDGVPVTTVRELRVLQETSHRNIVQLKKVVTGSKADRCAQQQRCYILPGLLSSRELMILCRTPYLRPLPLACSVFLVFEFCEHDLGRLADTTLQSSPLSLSEVSIGVGEVVETQKLTHYSTLPLQIKCLVRQLLEAVAYLHDRWIVHRCSDAEWSPFHLLPVHEATFLFPLQRCD